MTIPTPAELTLLRTYPQAAKIWLSIYQPPIVFEATINDDSISKGAMVITLGSTLSGSLEAVQPNYTMLVGTTRGNDDIGKVRIRYVSGNTIVVAENGDVEWLDGYYLTVLMFVEVNPVYPRTIQDPADPESVLWYKDYDIEYADQNNNLGVFMNMGCHTAMFLDDSNSAYLYYTASGTYSVGGDAMGYDWWFAGADGTTGSTAFVPGLIHYTQPGHYMTRLLVTGTATASSDIGYRFVSVYDRPENGTNTPFLNWEMLEMTGSRDDGGYSAKIRVRDSVSKSVVRDGALVVLFTDQWFGGNNEQAIGGNAIQRSNVFMTGWIINGSITYNYRDGYVDFEIGSPTHQMQTMESFAVSLESKTSASTWYELQDMDCRRAIYHYLRWHSTVLSLCDFEFRGTDQLIQFFDSDRESIYDAIATLLQSALRGELVSDRQGKLYSEISVAATDQAATAFPVALNIDKHDWIGEPVLDERIEKDISYMEIGGVAYDGPALGNNLPFISAAPGLVPSTRGKVQRDQGLALLSQPQLNILSGNLFAYANSRWPNIDYQMGGMFPNLDVAPQELIQVTMGATDTPRGVTFANKPFTLRSIQWTYNPRIETLLPSISVSEVTQGVPGTTVVIPVDPPADDGGGPNPPPPPGGGGGTTPPPPPPPFTGGPGSAVAFGRDNRTGSAKWVMAKTTSLSATTPAWSQVLSFSGSFRGFDFDPFNYGVGGYLLTDYGLHYVNNIFTTPIVTTLLTVAEADAINGGTLGFYDVKANPVTPGVIGVIVENLAERLFFTKSTDSGLNWTGVDCGRSSSSGHANSFEWGKATGTKVYVCSRQGGGGVGLINYSTNSGATFNAGFVVGGFYGAQSVTVPYGSDDIVYGVASNVYQPVYRSDDAGVSANKKSPDGQTTRTRPAPWWTVQSKRNEPQKLAILMPSLGETFPVKLYKSPDSGDSWTDTHTFSTPGDVPYGLVMHPYNDGIYYAHSVEGTKYFAASFDGGNTWSNKTGDWVTKFSSSPSGVNFVQRLYPVFKK